MLAVFFKMMTINATKSLQSRADSQSVGHRKSGINSNGSEVTAYSEKAQAATARRQEVKAPAKKSKVVSKSTSKSPVKAKPVAKKAVVKTAAKPKAKVVVKPLAKAKPIVKPIAKKPAGKKAVTAKIPPKPVVKPIGKTASKPVAKPVAKPVPKKPVQPVIKTPAKVQPKAVAKTLTKVSAKTPDKAPAKTAAKVHVKTTTQTPTKALSKAPKKTDIKPVQTLIPKAQPKPVATSTPLKPVASPLAPTKTKAGSRVVPSYAPSPSDMSPHGGNTAAKASFTMSAPVLVPPPQVVIKKDAKLVNNWKTKTAEQLSDNEVIAMPDSEYMNAQQLAFFRLKLVALKNGILSNAGETTEHLREDTSIVPDPADRATIEEEHALELRTRDRERKLLKKIEQSIVSIDAEEYGYCDETGEPIGVSRLIARPTATLSLEAQQRRELKQKMFGD